MVVIRLPAAALTGVTQERIGWPSRCTVQAPQSAIPQPNFVPVRPTTSRTTRQDSTLDPQLAGVLRDRPVERDLDLEARVAFAGLEGGMDRASHGGVEQGRCVAAVDGANRVVEALFGRGSEDDPPDLDL